MLMQIRIIRVRKTLFREIHMSDRAHVLFVWHLNRHTGSGCESSPVSLHVTTKREESSSTDVSLKML